MQINLLEQGDFSIGCNYWASHAGMFMWSDWDGKIVEEDLKQLSDSGLHILRVFPLWSDFQPLTHLKGSYGTTQEYRIGEDVLPNTESAQAGVSDIMMNRFKFLADTAEKYNLKLIVGLLTSWMSGRLMVPVAFENLNPLTNPSVIIWETRFIKYFVKYFKEYPSIIAWDLGNECNCMGEIKTREEAWLWTSQITNTIKVVDNSRPIVSGMHSLKADSSEGNWTIQDQGEITDILTTHPYPPFTPHCNQDPINEIRNGLHATAESCMYSDIGGVPCIVEEIGTLGPMICSDRIGANYIRATLFSAWSHDLRSLQWWCAYDQDHLRRSPYDWNAVERLLGLIRNDRKPKPVMNEFKKFRMFLDHAPKLPPRIREAVCILTNGQDTWGTAYTAFILAKQAGFDIEFQYVNQALKESSLYMLPNVNSQNAIPYHKWLELLKKVKNGATLYVSCSEGILAPFNEPFGLELQTREVRTKNAEFKILGSKFSIVSKIKLNLQSTTSKVIGFENDGNPAFILNKYGKGKIYFLAIPIEKNLSEAPGVFHKPDAFQWSSIYNIFADEFSSMRATKIIHPQVGVTEHRINEDERYVVIINYGSTIVNSKLEIKSSWSIKSIIHGKGPNENGFLKIPNNDACVISVEKTSVTKKLVAFR